MSAHRDSPSPENRALHEKAAKVNERRTRPRRASPACQAERRMRLLVNSVDDCGIFMLDTEGLIVSWNPGAERIKGYVAEEILGHHFSCFYLFEDRVMRKPETELELARVSGRYAEEGWRLRKDGSRFWASVTITAVRDGSGGLLGFSKLTRDLTERREAEQTLRESEERVRLMVEGVMDYAIFMLDPKGFVMSWNQGAERMKGYRSFEIIGRHFSCFYLPEDNRVQKPIQELLIAEATGKFEEEGWRKRKDGSCFWAHVLITTMRDGNGRILGFSKVSRDLTQRRETEERQRASEARLRALIECSSDGIIGTDALGVIDSANPAAARIFGADAGSLIGVELTGLIPTCFNDFGNQRTPSAIRNDGEAAPTRRVVRARRTDGTDIPIFLTLKFVRSGSESGFAAQMTECPESPLVQPIESPAPP